ncbi:MAG: DMT family transporter [Chloroflexota bacterium]
MLGVPLALLAALGWGISSALARVGTQHLKPGTATFISMISSLVLIGTLALAVNFAAFGSLSLKAWLWFGLIGLINFVIGRQCNYLSIRYIGVTRASPIVSLNPLISMILAVFLLGETVNVAIVIGTVCVVSGISLVVTSR